MATLTQFNEGIAGIRLRIDKPVFSIGRGKDNDISIDDELVSKLHAVIEAVNLDTKAEGYAYYLQDKDSTNGTYVNDKRVTAIRKLENDDIIRIGLSNFKFTDDLHEDLQETAQLFKSWIPGVYYTGEKKKKSSKKKVNKGKK